MSTEKTRKEFLKGLTGATLGVTMMRPSEIFGPLMLEKMTTSEVFQQFPQPNLKLAAHNLSMVPQTLFPHTNKEHVYMAINYGELGIGIYGSGVQKAIARKDQVVLVIEQPPKDKPEEYQPSRWRNYIREVAQLYRPSIFIVGNESNVEISGPSYIPPDTYVSLFEVAQREIKAASPDTRVFLYGEAYYGKGEYLTMVLQLLKQKGLSFDGLALHFYDQADRLADRMRLYREILNKNDFAGKSMIISELGMLESLRWTQEQYSTGMVQLLATAADLIERGVIEEACWYTAATFDHKNQKHALFQFSPQPPWESSRLSPTTSVLPWLLVTRLLYQKVRLKEGEEVTTVDGETAAGEPAMVVWNKTNKNRFYPLSSNQIALTCQGEKMVRTKEVFLPPSRNPLVCAGEPVFLVG